MDLQTTGGFPMRHSFSALLVLCLLRPAGTTLADEPPNEPSVIAKPEVFPTLDHPHCSHCFVEASRRKQELRADDRVLCWTQVFNDVYINDGVIPIRFFLNTYRVLMDTWGVFVYDPDAGFARGFAPDDGPFRFHGWRNGVMVIKSNKDGTLYSGLTGVAFAGPRKGHRLEPRPTLVTDWGFWRTRYPQAVAYIMYDKYKPVELPTEVNDDSRKSRRPADGRLPADTMVLGVWDGKEARAYPLDLLEKAGVIHDPAAGRPRVVLWYGPTRTAAAYHQPWGTSGLQGDAGWIFHVDRSVTAAPFVDQRTGLHWDITGRPVEGGPRLVWLDSVQVKWFAWAAEYPETSIYGKDAAKPDYKPLSSKGPGAAGPLGNLDATSRRFAILKATDLPHHRITLRLDGETEPKEWPLRAGAEVWHAGWWGRLDQFTVGDRVWVWFDTDSAKQPVAVSLLADELSEQDLYAPFTVKAVDLSGAGDGALKLETVRGGKPAARFVKFARAEIYRGAANAPHDSLKVGETVHVQSDGEYARLILDRAAFETRRAGQKAALRKRWADEGLPGTLIFAHPGQRDAELLLDHEAMRWGRSLQAGDRVTLQGARPMDAVVRRLRPWRERTQVLLGVEGSDPSALLEGARVFLRLAAPPAANDEQAPRGQGKSQSNTERVDWLISRIYCTCGMHDACAGHFFTLAACNPGPDNPCGMAKQMRAEIANLIDKGRTDQQIFQELLETGGPNLLRPHMMP
jgi:hypothetical protein